MEFLAMFPVDVPVATYVVVLGMSAFVALIVSAIFFGMSMMEAGGISAFASLFLFVCMFFVPVRTKCIKVIARDDKAKTCVINGYDVIKQQGDTLWIVPRF